MTTKPFKGKAIYNPSGKAGEYSYWACNFYTGCSNDCNYCYCKRGVLSSTWSIEPKLKSCFKDESHALELFEKELKQNISELQEHGLFFSFTTDPMLDTTYWLTMSAVNICLANDIPVKILTKCTRKILSVFFGNSVYKDYYREKKHLIAIGFTLTGHDELEQNASTNQERIEVMKLLYEAGFKTFASIEPVIDFYSSLCMILYTIGFCDLYKIGLMSNKKYSVVDAQNFINNIIAYASDRKSKVYFKDSLLKLVDAERILLPICCVERDYNLLKQK